MKYLMPFLLLPALVMAQAPGDGQKAPSFEQFKQTMQPVFKESLPHMKKTRACLSKADSKADVEKCMKAMAEMAQAMQQKMGMPAGAEQPSANMGKAPEDFEWNAETKANMLSHIDRTIKQSSAMQECLSKSNSSDEMGKCMQGKMPAPSR